MMSRVEHRLVAPPSDTPALPSLPNEDGRQFIGVDLLPVRTFR